jgi:hypothetical protein
MNKEYTPTPRQKIEVKLPGANHYFEIDLELNDPVPLVSFIARLLEIQSDPLNTGVELFLYHEDESGVFIKGTRMETDEEYAERLAGERKWHEETLERKRREYESLKKLFEPTDT